MTNLNILPTGTCFDDVADFINTLFRHDHDELGEIAHRYRILHGICHGFTIDPLSGLPRETASFYSHAWLYDVSMQRAIDFGLNSATLEKLTLRHEHDQFLHDRDVHEYWSYTLLEAATASQAGYASGPYNLRTWRLCHDTRNLTTYPAFLENLGCHIVRKDGAP